MFVSRLYVIGRWLKILAASVRACRRLQFFRMMHHTRIVEVWYRFKISLSPAAVTRLGCNIFGRGIGLTKSREFLVCSWGSHWLSLRTLHHLNTGGEV